MLEYPRYRLGNNIIILPPLWNNKVTTDISSLGRWLLIYWPSSEEVVGAYIILYIIYIYILYRTIYKIMWFVCQWSLIPSHIRLFIPVDCRRLPCRFPIFPMRSTQEYGKTKIYSVFGRRYQYVLWNQYVTSAFKILIAYTHLPGCVIVYISYHIYFHWNVIEC